MVEKKTAAAKKAETAADVIARELKAGATKFRVKADAPGKDIVVEVVPSFQGEITP